MVLHTPEPDAADQAYPFDPTTADKAAVDAKRAEERRIREDQRDRTLAVLARYFDPGDWPAALVARVDVEPGW